MAAGTVIFPFILRWLGMWISSWLRGRWLWVCPWQEGFAGDPLGLSLLRPEGSVELGRSPTNGLLTLWATSEIGLNLREFSGFDSV